MNTRKILYLLLALLVTYESYRYLQSTFESRKDEQTQEVTTVFVNPLRVVFFGSNPENSKGSYATYFVGTRLEKLVSLAFFVLLTAGLVQYIRSGKRKQQILWFFLICRFWQNIGGYVYVLIDLSFNKQYPDEPIVSMRFSLLEYFLYYISETIVIYFILRFMHTFKDSADPLKVNVSASSPQIPVTWARGFHYFFDRCFLFIIVTNTFFQQYYISSHYRHGAPGVLLNWGVLSFEAAIIVVYLLTEGLFHTSPAKILTGISIVRTQDEGVPTWKNMIPRALSRFIPLEPLSVLGSRLWHDRFSNTTVLYTSSGHWLTRQAVLVRWGFRILLSIGLWTLLAIPLEFWHSFIRTEQAALLPMVLLAVAFPFVATFFSCWIASFSNHAQNVGFEENVESNSHLLSAFLIWVPVFNFFMLSKITGFALEALKHASDPNSPVFRTLQKRTRQLNRAFAFAYCFLALAIVPLLFISVGTNELLSAIGFGLVGTTLWSIYAMRHAKAVQAFLTGGTTSPAM
jgi:hypothetical protein